MDRDARALLDGLLTTPSPSGREHVIQRWIHRHIAGYVETAEPDVHGNLLLGVNTKAERKILLDGHCDQIGFMVKYVDPEGFIYVDTLGGIDGAVLLGERVTIHAAEGPILGVFGRKPIHLQTTQELTQLPATKSMWIDIGANSSEEVFRRIKLGDYVTFQLHVNDLANNKVQAPGLDNKAGLFVVLQTLKRCAKEKLDVAVYGLSAVQEELGCRGASTAAARLCPDVGITVDVTHASDDPSSTDKSMVPCLLGKGPRISSGPNTNPVVNRLMTDAAKRLNIPWQAAPSAKLAGNDSKEIQTAGAGVAAGDLGIPNRNMHTQGEVCSLDDIDATVELLVEFIRSVKPETDFRPFHMPEE